jgi:alpha-beta hydrolase superfamily lysophospholipase
MGPTSRLENLPCTENFFFNERGKKLHFRMSLPTTGIRAVLFYLHGYCSHINRPSQLYFSESMQRAGVATFSFDFEGHGYSEGEPALISSADEFIADVVVFIKAVYGHGSAECKMVGGPDVNFVRAMSGRPYWVAGQSMGGGLAILSSMHLEGDPLFRGILLLAPAIIITSLPPMVRTLLSLTLFQCLPGFLPMAPALVRGDPAAPDVRSWSDPELLDYARRDLDINGGLRYSGAIKFSSLNFFLSMQESICEQLHKISCPFLVFHDPLDEICNIEGSRRLVLESSTPESNKRLIELPQGLHSLLCNETDQIANTFSKWINDALNPPLPPSQSSTS